MKTLEFKSKIKNNHIKLPKKIQAELKENQDKDIRVIVLIEDLGIEEDKLFQQTAKREFLNGYADSDSIYDN